MDNSKVTVFERRFLVSGLPPGHAPSEPHLQIFDNYLRNSNLCLRKIRNPETSDLQFILEKNYKAGKNPRKRLFERIILFDNEYSLFDGLRGGETRKNRYAFDGEDVNYHIDVYLGEVWGLNIATVRTASESKIDSAPLPPLFVHEITGDEFFEGRMLADLDFADIRAYLEQKKGGAGGASFT